MPDDARRTIKTIFCSTNPSPSDNRPRLQSPVINADSVFSLFQRHVDTEDNYLLGPYTSLILPLCPSHGQPETAKKKWDTTMRRNDANVRVNALIIQEDSAAVISSEITNDGIAEKRAVILNASINCARQNTVSNACLCA